MDLMQEATELAARRSVRVVSVQRASVVTEAGRLRIMLAELDDGTFVPAPSRVVAR